MSLLSLQCKGKLEHENKHKQRNYILAVEHFGVHFQQATNNLAPLTKSC